MALSRRHLLTAGLVTLAAGTLGELTFTRLSALRKVRPEDLFDSIDPKRFKQLADAYRANPVLGLGETELEISLFGNVGPITVRSLKSTLIARIKRDFEVGATLEVDLWSYALTEGALAHYSLLRSPKLRPEGGYGSPS